jgi:hypothetical protein
MKLTRLMWALAATLFFVSCQKDDNDDTATKDQAAKLSVASTTSSAAFNDVFDLVLQDGEDNGLGRTTSCATVSINPSTPGVFPKTVTIDFGAGCTSPNGITRRGKVIAVFSNFIHVSGSTINVTFDNYFVQNYKVEGNFSITNNGGTGLNFTTATTGGKLTYPDGTTYYNYNGTHTWAQTSGAGTLTFLDDAYTITGNSTTTASTGSSLGVNITTPLVKAVTCHNVSAGVQSFQYNVIAGTLDYGGGTCDNLATLTIGGFSQVIILP